MDITPCFTRLQTSGHVHHAVTFLDRPKDLTIIDTFTQFVECAFSLQVFDVCDCLSLKERYKNHILDSLRSVYNPKRHLFGCFLSSEQSHIQLTQSIFQLVCLLDIDFRNIFHTNDFANAESINLEVRNFTEATFKLLKNFYDSGLHSSYKNIDYSAFADSAEGYVVESDIRNTYSAFIILQLLLTYLNRVDTDGTRFNWHDIFLNFCEEFLQNALPPLLNYIIISRSYDGGFSLIPRSECHSGAAFCSVAFLCLSERILVEFVLPLLEFYKSSIYTLFVNLLKRIQRIKSDLSNDTSLLGWITSLQLGTFSGRPNKGACNCYNIWSFGTLVLLDRAHVADTKTLLPHLIASQNWIPFKYIAPTVANGLIGSELLTKISGAHELQTALSEYVEMEDDENDDKEDSNSNSTDSSDKIEINERVSNNKVETKKNIISRCAEFIARYCISCELYKYSTYSKLWEEFSNRENKLFNGINEEEKRLIALLWLIIQQNCSQINSQQSNLLIDENNKSAIEQMYKKELLSAFTSEDFGIIVGFSNEEKGGIDITHTYAPLYALSAIKYANKSTCCDDNNYFDENTKNYLLKHKQEFENLKQVIPELMLTKDCYNKWCK